MRHERRIVLHRPHERRQKLRYVQPRVRSRSGMLGQRLCVRARHVRHRLRRHTDRHRPLRRMRHALPISRKQRSRDVHRRTLRAAMHRSPRRLRRTRNERLRSESPNRRRQLRRVHAKLQLGPVHFRVVPARFIRGGHGAQRRRGRCELRLLVGERHGRRRREGRDWLDDDACRSGRHGRAIRRRRRNARRLVPRAGDDRIPSDRRRVGDAHHDRVVRTHAHALGRVRLLRAR
jgi:hypothetical protein